MRYLAGHRFWLLPALLLALGCSPAGSDPATPPLIQESRRVKAPDFPRGLEWFNTPKPPSLRDLRGKVVLLDFWTYCCINCMHIIPDLKRLEAEYPNELVVIGVHSAKFAQEKESDNIRQAVLRYEVQHPVVNDADFKVWRAYNARAWPTVVLIDPEGRIAMTAAGEGVYARFAGPIQNLVREYARRGKLDATPLELRPESQSQSESVLSFPGKILADPAADRLFVSDQNHNRVVVLDINNGNLITTIGSGERGFRDGDFATARFNHPQGMALAGDILYLADTENHAVREISLGNREVTTLAGNGRQASGFHSGAGRGAEMSLSSPWDLAYRDGILYVAMAGVHQIWSIVLESGLAGVFAGTSQEGLHDGSRDRAWLAQPSGLAILGDRLYFADSEVSAVRYVELDDPAGRVGTVVGLDLFEFGDRDGVGDEVRLQHPLGVAADDGRIYIADTYNNKIKVIDPQTRECRTFAGDGKPGARDGNRKKARFYEPGGLSSADGKLYIADTNNHLVRVIDIASGGVTTLQVGESASSTGGGDTESLPEMVVGSGGGAVRVRVNLPDGYKFNPGSALTLSLLDGGGVCSSGTRAVSIPAAADADFSLPVEWTPGNGVVKLEVDYIYCSRADEAVCKRGYNRLQVPVRVAVDAATTLQLNLSPR